MRQSPFVELVKKSIPSPGGRVAPKGSGEECGQEPESKYNIKDLLLSWTIIQPWSRSLRFRSSNVAARIPLQSPPDGGDSYESRCDCPRQSLDFDSLRGAPPRGEAMGCSRTRGFFDSPVCYTKYFPTTGIFDSSTEIAREMAKAATDTAGTAMMGSKVSTWNPWAWSCSITRAWTR